MKYLYCQQKSLIRALDSSEIKFLDTSCFIDLIVLEKDFYFKHKVNIKFSLIVNNIIIYYAIKQFYNHIVNVIKYLNYICCCSNYFINFT